MHHHKVVLNFDKKCVRVNRQEIPAVFVMGERLGNDANRYRLRQPTLAQGRE